MLLIYVYRRYRDQLFSNEGKHDLMKTYLAFLNRKFLNIFQHSLYVGFGFEVIMLFLPNQSQYIVQRMV